MTNNPATLEFQALILRWRSNPVAFVKEVFNATLEPWQAEALALIVTDDRITIKSGHGVGKSTFLAWAVLWFMSCFYPCKVPCTAPSSHQLYDILWAEIKLWHRKMPEWLRSQFDIKSDKIDLVGGGDTFAVARTSRQEAPDALQGFHSENLLFLIDEASGVPDIIFEVAGGALSTPGAKQILTGNPIRTKGYFARSHAAASKFKKMTVSCFQSSRVSKEYIEDMAAEYGVESNVYRYRVLGEFPLSDTDVLIPLELVMAAVNREIIPFRNERPTWGLDVARYGVDRSCLVKRHPRQLKEAPKIYKGLSTMELVGRVKNEWDNTPEKDRPDNIYVDVIGLGAGVVDRLQELELPVVGINVSESPAILVDNVFRMKDELWMNAFKWFDSLMCSITAKGSEVNLLIDELTSVKKGFTSSGKMRMESKDDMKRRGLRSPDVAEAFVLTFPYQSGIATGSAKNTNSNWKIPISRNCEGSYV